MIGGLRTGWGVGTALLGMMLAGLAAAPASAAEIGSKGPSEAIFVAQLVLLLFVGRLFGEILQRFGQPAVIGQLLAGIALGPSVFGALWPGGHDLVFPHDPAQKAMINGVAQLGVLLLLMLTGMETDVALVKRVGRAAVTVSVAGIAVPFACGVLLGLYVLPDSILPSPEKRLVTALFLGTALSISSIKIVAMVVREMNFMRRDLGQVIVASAIIDDTIGWIIVALIFGVAHSGGLEWRALATTVGTTVLFLGLSYTLGRRLVAWLIRLANDRLVSELPVITVILIIMGGMAIVSDVIGVNTVLGAFVAGVLIGQSPLLTKHIDGQLRGMIVALFAPVFFGLAGLSTDVTILKQPALFGLTAALILVASLGKFGGAFIGGALGGLKGRESLALALGMNARGSTEVIVASLGLSVGALNDNLFSMIVAMAVFTTMLMPPTLRWALARLPIGEDEGKRLAREAYDEHGFVAGLERLLVDADDSSSGRLASRLAGMLGGPRGLPITVLRNGGADADAAAAQVAIGAEAVRGASHDADEVVPDITAAEEQPGDRAAVLAAQAGKGFDLLAIGVEPALQSSGVLTQPLVDALKGFAGPQLIAVAPPGDQQSTRLARILVPVKGTESSRRAAEFACALAQSGQGSVDVVFVTDPDEAQPKASMRRLGRDVLRDIDRIAERYEVRLRKRLRVSDQPGEAVLRLARRLGSNLIVLGVESRASGTLPFGATAATVLSAARFPVALLTGEARQPEVDSGGG